MTTQNTANATQGADGKVVETPAVETPVVETQAKATTETTTTEVKAEGDGSAKAESERVIPESYDFQAPEGSILTQADIQRIEAHAKEKGMTAEEATEFFNSESGKFQSVYESRKAEFDKTVESWKEDALKDPEIGGENFTKNMEFAKRTLTEYGNESLQQILKQSGLGNHPEVLRFLSKLGAAMSEDTVVIPNAQVEPVAKSREEILYPTMKK